MTQTWNQALVSVRGLLIVDMTPLQCRFNAVGHKQQEHASTLNAAAGSSGYSFGPASGYALSRYSTTSADSMIVAPWSIRTGT